MPHRLLGSPTLPPATNAELFKNPRLVTPFLLMPAPHLPKFDCPSIHLTFPRRDEKGIQPRIAFDASAARAPAQDSIALKAETSNKPSGSPTIVICECSSSSSVLLPL